MIETLTKNWLLLAVCGVLNAIIAAIYLVMRNAEGPLAFRSWNGTILLLGKLALAAAVCTIAAGIWRSANGKCWPLVLNGLAFGALGLIQYAFVRYPISFLTVALLIILMAISAGTLELSIGRTMQRQHHTTDGRIVAVAGVASVGFALAFLALGFRWISVEPGSHADLLWLGAYFAFSTICMLGLAWRVHSQGPELHSLAA